MQLTQAAMLAYKAMHSYNLGLGPAAFLVGNLSQIKMVPHYGLCCFYEDGSFRAGSKILALVQGQQRSMVETAGDGKKIETAVTDPSDSNITATLRTYCKEVKLLDFKLDRNLAAVLITAVDEKTPPIFDIDFVKLLKKEDGVSMLQSWASWIMATQASGGLPDTPTKKRPSLGGNEVTPTLRKCRTLARTPTDG